MRYHEISEAPIEDLTHVGDWTKSSSFRHEQDRKLLTNPKAIRKITAQWERTPVDFNVYLVNNPDGRKWGEVGAVDQEWVEKNLPNTAPFFEYKPNAVNILFMNNTGDERVPFTGWIMAHRFGHAISRYSRSYNGGRQFPDFTDARATVFRITSMILNDAYGRNVPDDEHKYDRVRENEKLMIGFFEHIGTMRSARTGSIRTEFEFTLELLAQYMLTGRIKFNPLPKSFKYGRNYASYNGTEYDWEYYNNALEDLAEELGHHFDNLMHRCVGSILVM